MEQMSHHREGIQEQLDKAYDEAQAKIAEIKGEEVEEMQGKLSLEETVMLLEKEGVLDASFEGKEFHRLEMRPLTKEEAFTEYRNSGGNMWIQEALEKNMYYSVPRAEILDVMIMSFGKTIGGRGALAEIDKLGVRSLDYEEIIQYGIANPEHQNQNPIVGFTAGNSLGTNAHALVLGFDGVVRYLSAGQWDADWGDKYRFLVVRK